MDNMNSVEIITQVKQYEIHSPVGQNIIILTTSQNLLNILKGIMPPPPSKKHLTKNLEAISVALYKPSLSNQKSFDRLMLFRNGRT